MQPFKPGIYRVERKGALVIGRLGVLGVLHYSRYVGGASVGTVSHGRILVAKRFCSLRDAYSSHLCGAQTIADWNTLDYVSAGAVLGEVLEKGDCGNALVRHPFLLVPHSSCEV